MLSKSRLSSVISRLTVFLALFVPGAVSALPAAEAEAEHHEALPLHAEEVFPGLPITNSMIMVWFVAVVLILVARIATKDIKLVPSGVQNFVEWLVESLLNFFSGIMGEHLAKRTFWFIGTVFILILFSNWFGLIPGVGTIGHNLVGEGVDPHDKFRPFLRGANADLNLTMAMAATFFLLWFYWAFTEIGLKNFLLHIFAPKGKFKGAMMVFMVAIFLLVGLIEVLSIAVRPVALTFRLYGNIYAGENMLETLMGMVNPVFKPIVVIPFYFLELLVGLVQALVFALLCAVFTKLICEHHDEEHEHGDEHGDESADEHDGPAAEAAQPS